MNDEQRHSRSETAKSKGEQNSPRRLSFLQASVAVMLTLAVLAAIVIPFLDESLLDMAELSARSFLGEADAIATPEVNGQAATGTGGLPQIAEPIYARPGATGTPHEESEGVADAAPSMQLAPGAIQLPTATPIPEEEVAGYANPTAAEGIDMSSEAGAETEAFSGSGAGDPDAAPPLDIAATILNADNLLVSTDAEVLGALLRDNERAIGLLDHASVEGDLRTLSIVLPDGSAVGPSLNSVSEGIYPLVHSLYLYTTGAALQNNPAAIAFIGCYLVNVQDEWAALGFYPADGTVFDDALAQYEVMTGYAEGQLLRSCLSASDETASVETRSTTNLVALTEAIAARAAADGFAGQVQIEPVSAEEDAPALCASSMGGPVVDLLVSDVPLPESELQACEEAGTEPLAFIIGQSASAVVVSTANTFANRVTLAEAYALLSTARHWSDVRDTWPDAPITRAVADPHSGTFVTFVAAVDGGGDAALASDSDAEPVAGAATVAGTEIVSATLSVTNAVSLASSSSATPSAQTGSAPVSSEPLTRTVDTFGEPTGTADASLATSESITVSASITERGTVTSTSPSTPTPGVDEMPRGDLVLGVVEDREPCTFVAAILTQALDAHFGVDVVTASFATVDDLYAPLLDRGTGNGGVDLTPCQMDPADRELLRVEGDAVSLIGSAYASSDSQRYLVLANADDATTLRRTRPCVYEFISRMDLGDLSDSELDVELWLVQNSELIEEWALCEGEE